jgi:hypothetical protein
MQEAMLDCAAFAAFSTHVELQEAGENLLFYLSKGQEGQLGDLEETPYVAPPYTIGHVRRKFWGESLYGQSDITSDNVENKLGQAMDVAEKFTLNTNNEVNFVSTSEERVELTMDDS